jgi:hypothetical protein
MKKIILLFLLSSSALMAQEFKPELLGKFQPAKVKFGDGKETDVLMKYQTFESFKNPLNKFRISTTTSEADAYDQTGGIEAFMIDGVIWALRPVPGSGNQFVVLKQQGAIETYEYVKYGTPNDKPNQVYVVVGLRTVPVTRKISTGDMVQGVVPDEKLRGWIADSPEALEDLKQAEVAADASKRKQDSVAAAGGVKPKEAKFKGLMGALEKANNKQEEIKEKATASVDWSRIINNYNAGYESRNSGNIRYHFDSPPVWQNLAKPKKTSDELKAERDLNQQKIFGNRTTTPSPENASAKDNVPVKKETFAAKLNRIKADGNKVGVILYLEPVRVNPPDASGNTTGGGLTDYAKVVGEYMDESLNAAAQEFVTELNRELETTDIELIDIQKVPYRDSKFGKLDDWWASKYKVVFAYSLDPRIRASNEEIGGKTKFTASLNMIQSLIVREYIGGPGATKQDIITQVLNMGSFVTPTYAQDDQMTDVKSIYDKTLEKLAIPILSKMREERADGVKKLVEKRLKP